MQHKKTDSGFCFKDRGFLMVFLIARFQCQNGGISISGSPNLTISKTSRYSNPVDEYSCIPLYILLFTFGPKIWRHAWTPKMAAAPNCSPLFSIVYRKTSNISRTLVGSKIVDYKLRCSLSIACRRCSNYIFILNLTPGFNGLSEDNCMRIQETFKFWNLVRLIQEVLR